VGWLSAQFELARGAAGSNLRPMEGLRGFAVALVFLVHYATLVEPWLEEAGDVSLWLARAHSIGNAGVDLFFVLSGYLIYGSLIGSQQSFWRYLWRRVRRIYPAFLAVFAVYLVLTYAQPLELRKVPEESGDAALFIVQNLLLLPGIFAIDPLITVAWSLSYELFYYLVMPLLVAVFGLRLRTPRWRCCFFVGMTVAAFGAAAVWGGHVRLTLFLAGVLLFELLRRDKGWAPPGLVTLGLLVAGLLAMLMPMPGPAGQALRSLILFGTFFALCWNVLRMPAAPLASGFSWLPLRWLGNMSYSFYLLHGLALKFFFMGVQRWHGAAPSDPLAVAMVVPALGFSLLMSSLLFLAIERPLSLASARGPGAAAAAPRQERHASG
jgi:exopolysaccharide production protein ExoZ